MLNRKSIHFIALLWALYYFFISLGIKAECQYICWLSIYIFDIYYFPSALLCTRHLKLLSSEHRAISLSRDVCTFFLFSLEYYASISLWLTHRPPVFIKCTFLTKVFLCSFIYILTIATFPISILLYLFVYLCENYCPITYILLIVFVVYPFPSLQNISFMTLSISTPQGLECCLTVIVMQLFFF